MDARQDAARDRRVLHRATAGRRAGSSRAWGSSAPGRLENGLEDSRVARAAAQIAGQRRADILLARFRRTRQQLDGGENHPGRTDAALGAAPLEERLLYCVQRLAPGDA